MIEFGVQSIADYMTVSWLFHSLNRSRQSVEPQRVYMYQEGTLSTDQYNEIYQKQYHALAQWLPVFKEYLMQRRKLFLPIYQNIQYHFVD